MTKVLLLGLGRWGGNHLRVLHGLPVDLFAADVQPKSLEPARKLGLPESHLTTRPEDFFERIDAAVVATPAPTHFELTRALLERGKDVFVEKPITLLSIEAERLARLAEARQRLLQVGHIFRFDPASDWLRDAIRQGQFGQVRLLRGNFSGFKRPRNDSGVAFADAIHFVDLFNYLLGRDPVRVWAVMQDFLGRGGVQGLKFVCSDMWQPYLQVIARQAGQALHVLDRLHISGHLNQALDQVRRAESGRLRGRPLAQRLKKMRWHLLKRGRRVRGHARLRLNALLASKLATARAGSLKDCFEPFWHYRSVLWARSFLDYWCTRALRSRLGPMQKVARMLRSHRKLLLNWFRAKGEVSSGAVEGLNNKIRVVTRRSYGFRTFDAMEVALYHTLGRLPEPETTHRFC